MKILCVLLPHFPLACEVRRNPAIKGCPTILTYTPGSQKLVLDYYPEIEGLQRDMPLQQALSRHNEVKLLQADTPYYRSVFNDILDALEQKSPLVEGPDPGCVYIGADGLQLIYPDDDALLKAIREAIPETFTSQIGIAGNKFLAYLAARRSPPGGHRILTGDAGTFLKDLPCDVLPVSIKSRDRLRDFGMRTLGQVAALPPGPVQSQFGPEGKRIWELARGHDDTPLYPRMMEEIIEESITLSSVTVSLEAILVAAELLLTRVFARVGLKGLGIRSLTLWTRSWSAEHWERTIQFKEPAMDTITTLSRVKRVLEDYPQPGPVEQVGMRINRLGYPRGRQKSLFSEVRAQEHLLEDIRQLELRLGNPQIYKVKEVEPWSRIPERRYALTPTSR
ncbi:MAG TPA: DNA polymerase Y family protein [Dehalococcoidales bacterium]|nr:DNA polymerase Y family protein [Dehalococcoidales bacterium]